MINSEETVITAVLLSTLIAEHTGIAPEDAYYLLELDYPSLISDPLYQAMLLQVNHAALQDSLPEVQRLLEDRLPGQGPVLSEWLAVFVTDQDDMLFLPEPSPHRLQDVFPHLLDQLATLKESRTAWQQALATLIIPLVIK